jgi:hypothetical protein
MASALQQVQQVVDRLAQRPEEVRGLLLERRPFPWHRRAIPEAVEACLTVVAVVLS